MPRLAVDVWLSTESLRSLHGYAGRHHPNEAGGLLLGYWSSPRECVVQAVTGPGPKAEHHRYKYIPDYAHDEEQALAWFEHSGGVTAYLGDWHSHPNTRSPYLSSKDRRALRNIAGSVAAKAPRPLSLVCAGGPSEWRPAIWVGEMARYWFGLSFLAVIRTNIIDYEAE